jgi:hypothetical protein
MGDFNMTDAEAEAAREQMRSDKSGATVSMVAHTLDFIIAFAQKADVRVKALDARIAELEKAPLVYEGPHEQGKTYARGQFVTHDGSLWHANYKTGSRPGDGPGWTLAVKRGRDAR